MATLEPQLREIDNGNGQTLASHWFQPAGAPRGAVLIAPAMGVKQRFYAEFAAWLASEGFLAVTFDYAGIGASRRSPLAELDVDVLDWTRNDCSAMLDALAEAAGEAPLCWIGHSLGAQIIPLVRGHDRLSRILIIAAGSGYWRENTPALRQRVWLLWFVVAPLLTPLFGYFPGARLGMVGDLPRGVIRQWRHWCLHPEYLLGVEGEPVRQAFAALRTPISALTFIDDELMSARNSESLLSFYRGAPLRHRRLDPRDVGVDRIGHFGFFRPALAELWARLVLPELTLGTTVRTPQAVR